MVRLLIAFGFAVLSAETVHARVRAEDFFTAQPLLDLAEAAAKGRVEEIGRLLKAGANVNAKGRDGMTVLIWALLQQNKKGYQCLLENGADPNLQVWDSTLTWEGMVDGNSATSLAAMHEDPWYLEVTLKHGGNSNLRNPIKGITPIFQCITFLDQRRPKPRLEQLKMLIAAGADVNDRDRDGNTPIMMAAVVNRYDMVHVMLEAGADPTIKNKAGKTIADRISHIRTDPKSELYQWRARVIEFLKAKGIEVAADK